MSPLPDHPDLNQARRQAKDLLRAARSADAAAIERMAAVNAALTLAGAQLAIAREQHLPSWPALVREIQARNTAIPEDVLRFLRFSVNLQIFQAVHMLEENPALARSGFPAAVVLGDAVQVESELRRNPGAATRVDPDSGWTALHLACASRFHLDPSRATGLAEVARLLLDAGADVDGQSAGTRCWRPLECAVISANSSPNNEAIIRLLLERGAPVRPETITASLYAADGTWCLELLTNAATDTPALFTEPLIEAVANDNLQAVRVLLGAGADPDAPSRDGGSARRRALTSGVAATLAILGGPSSDPVDQLLAALLAGDADRAHKITADNRGIISHLDSRELTTMVAAAEHGNTAAVTLMLELGFPVNTPDDDGATALHTASWAGSADTVALLLDHGADVTARDTNWHSQPLGWALQGSSEAPHSAPAPDWVATITHLLDAGAALDEIAIDPNDPQQPSPAVLELLRARAGDL